MPIESAKPDDLPPRRLLKASGTASSAKTRQAAGIENILWICTVASARSCGGLFGSRAAARASASVIDRTFFCDSARARSSEAKRSRSRMRSFSYRRVS